MDGIEPVDMIVIVLLVVASMRGFVMGVVRESFSLAGIAGAYLVVTLYAKPTAAWLVAVSEGGVAPAFAPLLAGLGLVVLTIGLVTTIGRVVRRGIRAVGLGLVDRVGGAALGGAEGALIVAILLILAGRTIGLDHAALTDTRAVATLGQLQAIASEEPADIDVAAPPPNRRRDDG
jgi:membrane protein required for colicin V production